MATLTVQDATLAGTTPTYAAATVSDTFANDGRTFLHVKVGATATNVTINSVTPCNQGEDHDIVLSGLANTERIIGPFPTSRFNDTTGMVTVTYSQVTGVTAAVVRVP
jgi:hypothetical protein